MLSTSDLDRLASHLTIDITTTGRRSGLPRRIEIWWFRVDGRFVITGTPGARDWIANLKSDPRLTVHVDGLDIDATVTTVTDEGFRRKVFSQPNTRWYSTQSGLERLVRTAPMVEVHLPVE